MSNSAFFEPIEGSAAVGQKLFDSLLYWQVSAAKWCWSRLNNRNNGFKIK